MKNLVSIDTGKKGAAVLWRGNEPLDVYLFEEWEDGIDSNAFDRQLSDSSKPIRENDSQTIHCGRSDLRNLYDPRN